LSLIAFVGSVFSPYYAWQRRRWGDDQALPERHAAVNVSLYRRAAGSTRWAKWWTMTERGKQDLRRRPGLLGIGPSRLRWAEDGGLHIELDEWTAPWPRRLRGRLRLQPQWLPGQQFALDAGGQHHWQPICPRARIEVELDAPRSHWQGDAYLDANWGRRPLARDFASWHWSRQHGPDGDSRLLYAVQPVAGEERLLALRVDADGRLSTSDAPPPQTLPMSGWGVARQTRAEAAAVPGIAATLESGPFYCRSLLSDPAGGAPWLHESLDLRRFERPLVQAMLPFRMPRWANRGS
jgi:carotenoid 1,2-hydratase